MSKNLILVFILLLLFSLTLFSAFSVFAQTGGNNPPGPPPGTGGNNPPPGPGTGGSGAKGFELKNPIKSENFADIMQKIANLVAMIALPLVVVMIIWAGAQFVFARGNDTKLTAAKNTLWYAIIGALLVVGAFAIATAIKNFAEKL